MKESVFYIKHKSGLYNFVQRARCRHCLFCYIKGSEISRYRVCWCSLHRFSTSLDRFSCELFVCNGKYVLSKNIVQLNLFDYAKQSVSELSTVH